LRAALAAGGARTGLVVSTDLFYDPDDGRVARWARAGAVAVEMEAAALFTVASRRGAAAACLLAVTNLLAGGGHERIGDAELAVAERALGESALAALV
ncbi:MAG: purine-nucleoside phosphorylase, partial [Actinomycetota bacterium]|nr:purine-nucleoside phosphorylase [Actinomycetota bacterium]